MTQTKKLSPVRHKAQGNTANWMAGSDEARPVGDRVSTCSNVRRPTRERDIEGEGERPRQKVAKAHSDRLQLSICTEGNNINVLMLWTDSFTFKN